MTPGFNVKATHTILSNIICEIDNLPYTDHLIRQDVYNHNLWSLVHDESISDIIYTLLGNSNM